MLMKFCLTRSHLVDTRYLLAVSKYDSDVIALTETDPQFHHFKYFLTSLT